MKKHLYFFGVTAFLIINSQVGNAQVGATYQQPPKEILELANAPVTPSVNISKSGNKILILSRPGYPSIEQVAQPVAGLAGLRINPATNGSAVGVLYSNISLKENNGKEIPINGIPEKARISDIRWNKDETKIAFTNETENKIELWVADLKSFSAQKLIDQPLNAIYGTTIQWNSEGTAILGLFVPENRKELTEKSLVPEGPVIQESLGKVAPSRTYQNLLQNKGDEDLFDYYLTSQIKLVSLNGEIKNLGNPAIYKSLSYSPDGNYLLVQTIERPYSYLVPIYSFPFKTVILNKEGDLIKDMGLTPLAENIPIGFDAVIEGPRNYNWRPDKGSSIYWVEALDGGNPNKDFSNRDAIFQLHAPFSDSPIKMIETQYRYRGIDWGNEANAILNERWWKTRKQKATLFNPSNGNVIKVIADRSYEDQYTDPGDFVMTQNEYNRSVLLFDKSKDVAVFTMSDGASPEGDRPFLLKWNLNSGKQDTLFKSNKPYYESPVFFDNKGTFIISKESIKESPNYYNVNLKTKKLSKITDFADPYPSLNGIHKEQVFYPRKDSITLSGVLYLPKNYSKEDGALPLLIWAYPREFKSSNAADQVKGSPYRFTRISWGSPIFWVMRGYAVLDNADMPIVGTGDEQPNDSFVEQIKWNAEAAINYLADRGVADPKRVAVGGHSYGAFMTANLLAHTDLFAAGIARSGAYNRTFTPFGFQAEERTYWEAPEVYYKMSPFSFADKIKTPLLLIHGIDDENSGTFPIQSERFYNALKGQGGTARLVMLPHEFHGYRAKESVLHTLWEMDQWLEKYVKNKE